MEKALAESTTCIQVLCSMWNSHFTCTPDDTRDTNTDYSDTDISTNLGVIARAAESSCPMYWYLS
jgi:hypothetical protein